MGVATSVELLGAGLAMLIVSACATSGTSDLAELRTATLQCGGWIEDEVTIPDSYEEILGVIALPTVASAPEALQVTEFDEAPPAEPFFAKTGLVVRPDAAFELEVIEDLVGSVALGWSDAEEATERVIGEPCDSGSGWVAYAGGFVVAEPRCVELRVTTGGATVAFEVGVGAPCVGQAPAP